MGGISLTQAPTSVPPGQNQEPVDWTGVDAQPSSPSWIPFPGGLEVESGESSVGPRAEDV